MSNTPDDDHVSHYDPEDDQCRLTDEQPVGDEAAARWIAETYGNLRHSVAGDERTDVAHAAFAAGRALGQREGEAKGREGIIEAMKLIHADESEGGDYNRGMDLLSRLAGLGSPFAEAMMDHRLVAVSEIARRIESGES